MVGSLMVPRNVEVIYMSYVAFNIMENAGQENVFVSKDPTVVGVFSRVFLNPVLAHVAINAKGDGIVDSNEDKVNRNLMVYSIAS